MLKYQYDFFVIGGGSGGLSASSQAAKLGKKVGLADFVKPTPKGTKWGIGGTCVNVGCIPKKLMHHAALTYEMIPEYEFLGHPDTFTKKHDWNAMVGNIQMHIKKLNFGYMSRLRKEKVVYYNKLARLISNHEIELEDVKGNKEIVTAEKILLATGGRPRYLNVPGAQEHCITSDDIFSLKKAPGKTLIVGASYIALECGGFLTALGYETHCMVRSVLLSSFDQGMATRIGDYMKKHGTNFIEKCVPTKFTGTEGGRILVEYQNTQTKEVKAEEFDTCLLAIGRDVDFKSMNLDKVGINTNPQSGKIIVNEKDETNVSNIYAIGDCVHGRMELTPPAIMAGRYLADRLFADGKQIMDYKNMPTTVFTPLEYGTCGLTEKEAKDLYGAENIKVWHSEFTPLEWSLNWEREDTGYTKVICNTALNDLVVGFHILSPNAGEITQGVGIAMKCGMTKKHLDETVGIHPTVAEEITTLNTTTDMGDGKKTGC